MWSLGIKHTHIIYFSKAYIDELKWGMQAMNLDEFFYWGIDDKIT